MDIEKLNIDEKTFRWMLNEDQCASDLLPAGIRAFAKDTEKLETLIDADLKANPTIIKSDKKEEEKIVEEEKNA